MPHVSLEDLEDVIHDAIDNVMDMDVTTRRMAQSAAKAVWAYVNPEQCHEYQRAIGNTLCTACGKPADHAVHRDEPQRRD